jgi:pyruvate/2-oxoacid:ferredoxin oxidoreductase beta subunit
MRHFEEVPLTGRFLPGHAACPGCGEAQAIKFFLNALGPDAMLVVTPSCISVIVGPQPLRSMQLPVFQSAFAAAAASAAGLRRALLARGEGHVTVAVLAGDGGTYDIGLQALSAAAERNEDILYCCLDNEGYMNTGAQKSGATPAGAYTASTPRGKPTPKKDLAGMLAVQEVPYAATATVGFPDDLARKVRRAGQIRGFRYINILAPCLPGWGMADDQSVRASRMAVETCYYPLYEVEDGRRWTVNRVPERPLPVRRFLEMQQRFAHLAEDEVAAMQERVDERWRRLLQRAGIPAGAAAHPAANAVGG